MGGPLKCAAAIAAALAFAVLIAACGGGDDDSTRSESATDTAGVTTSPEPTSDGARHDSTGGSESSPSEPEGKSPSSDASGGEGEAGVGGNGASAVPHRGSVSSQSASFQKYSGRGKLHLAEFGEEASGGDLGGVQDVVVTYLQATGAEEWEKACAYLAAATRAQIEQLAQQSKQTGSGSCGETLHTFVKAFAPKGDASPVYASEGIASLRIQEGGRAGDGAGFALFHGSDGEDHWLAVKSEGGEWKILSTAPQPFQ